MIAGRKQLFSGDIQPIQGRFQIPINHRAASPGGPPLGMGFPFDESIVLEQMFARIESGSFVGAGNDFGGRFLSQHEIPGYVAFDIGHGREIAIERQRPFALENTFADGLPYLRRRHHGAAILPSLGWPGQLFAVGIDKLKVLIAGISGAAVPVMLITRPQH